MVTSGRYASALAAVTVVLAGCGGSARTATVTSPAASPFNAGTSSSNAITLPASSNGPTTCTVYESGYATQVVFESQSFDVRAACRDWTRNNAEEGYLWGYQPASATAEPAEATQVCYLTDPRGNVAARVIEATGFRTVSAAEAAKGSSACGSLLNIGWTKRSVARTTAPASAPEGANQ